MARSARRVEDAVQAILPAPMRLAQNTTARPMGPAPMTRTRWPDFSPATFTAWSPTASGSTSAPSVRDTPDGMRTH